MRISFKEKMNKKQVPQKDTCSLKNTFINTLLKREKSKGNPYGLPLLFWMGHAGFEPATR
jgi:hypothetical protein